MLRCQGRERFPLVQTLSRRLQYMLGLFSQFCGCLRPCTLRNVRASWSWYARGRNVMREGETLHFGPCTYHELHYVSEVRFSCGNAENQRAYKYHSGDNVIRLVVRDGKAAENENRACSMLKLCACFNRWCACWTQRRMITLRSSRALFVR